jgi:hypothetical protein
MPPKGPKSKSSSDEKSSVEGTSSKSDFHEYHLGVVKSKLDKFNKLDLPDELVKQEASQKNNQLWQDYHKSHWFPIGVLDKNDNLVKNLDIKSLKGKLEYKHDMFKSPPPSNFVIPKSKDKGIFWLKHVTSYVYGEIVLTISLEKGSKVDCEPYKKVFTITVDEDGNAESAHNKDDKKKSGKKGRAKIEDDEESSADETPPKKKGRSKKVKDEDVATKGKGRGRVKKRSDSMKSADEDAVPKKRQRKSKKQLEDSDEDSDDGEEDVFMERVLPVPLALPIGTRSRFARWPIDADAKYDKYRIDGPQQFINLTPPLVTALLDDKIRVGSEAIRHETEKKAGARRTTIEVNYDGPLKYWFQRPTVNEIFAKIVRSTIQSEGLADIVQQMQYLFEFCFENSILYASERLILRDVLERIKNDEEKFADNFGSIYFLRFIVLFTSLADTLGGGTSSNRGTDRFTKTMFAKSQLVLHAAVKELDDGSQNYFP